MKNLYQYVIIAFVAMSCSKAPEKDAADHRKFVDVAGIDTSVKPGDNFFRYVNGIWYDTVKIADDQVGVGSYSFLNIPQKVLLEKILKEVSSETHPAGSIEQKVGDFYASGMDTATINQRGFAPVKPLLEMTDGIRDVPDLMEVVAAEMRAGDGSLIGLYVSPDQKNSKVNIVHAVQFGIGLPDRDYYFKTDSVTAGIQLAYRTFLATLFQLTGDAPDLAGKQAETVYSIQKQLAKSHKTRIERRNVQENYHKMAVADLEHAESNVGWKYFLTSIGIMVDSLDVQQPAYYETLNKMLDSVSISDWKIYLKASILTSYASVLSKPFQEADFAYAKVLNGQFTQKTRAQQMVEQVDHQLGMALGQLYVKRYFNEEAKQRVLELVNNLQKAFEKRISELDWMSDSTKVKAKEKLYAITKKIGYPDVWRSYEVTIDRDRFFENVVALNANEFHYQLEKLHHAPDKSEWHSTPSTVTAYYNPPMNEIVFPAGILQYPYFDFYADDAINYGGIGMVIGHEMTHAFDDQGAQYDKDGNVKNWWTAADYEQFKAKTQLLIDRYSTFTVLDSVHVKGAMTIGENTADNGGIAMAYEAFKMTAQGQDTTKIDGFTPDQRFFLSIARIWRVKTRDEFMRTYVNTNPHSPAMWRVNGPLMNFTPFYEAFGVQPGDQNYKPESERIKIW